jgi:hypothetical protein
MLIAGYIYDIINFPFTWNYIRISFINFWPGVDKDDCWFLAPFKSYPCSRGKPYKIAKYFKIDIQFFSVFGSIDKLIKLKAKYEIFFTGENVNENSICFNSIHHGLMKSF